MKFIFWRIRLLTWGIKKACWQKLILLKFICIAIFFFGVPIFAFSQSIDNSATKSYTFTLTTSATVSAGVYNGNILLRTLFNTTQYNAGTYTLYWDGKDDDGTVMPSGDYKVKIFSHNITFTWEGTIGACNNSDLPYGPGVWNFFAPISDMTAISYNGVSYMDVGIPFSEGQAGQRRFDIAHPRTAISYRPGRTTGQATYLKCSNDTYIFNGGVDYCGNNNFVFATDLAGNDASFTNQRTEHPCNGPDINNAIDLNANGGTGAQRGIACTNKFLFVSRQDSLLVYRIDDGSASRLQSILLTGATKITNEGQNILWICFGNNVNRYTINTDGSLTSSTLTISGFARPAAIDVLAGDLCVFDGGNQQVVKRFNSTSGTATGTIGTVGSYATSPAVTNTKFYIEDARQGGLPTYVRHQSDGTIWIGDTGNKRNMHFSASGVYIDDIHWLPATYYVSDVINQPDRVFAGSFEYSIDYSKPIATRCTLLNNWGFKFPAAVNGHGTIQDLFNGIGLFSNGHRYGIGNIGIYGNFIFELANDGFKAIEGSSVPQFSQLGDDLSLNNSGYAQSAQTGYTNYTDGQPYPTWSGTPTYINSPAIGSIYPQITDRKIHKTDNGNIVVWDGQKDAQKYQLAAFDPANPTIWKWKRLPSTIPGYDGDFVDNAFDKSNGVIYPGGPVGVAGKFIISVYRGENWKNGQTSKYYITHQDGFAIGTPGVVQAQISDDMQPAAMYATNILTIITHEDSVAHKFYWMVDDENGHAIQSWIANNTNSVNIQTIPFDVPTKLSLLSSGIQGVDLLTGTPENSIFTGVPGWTRYPATDNSIISTHTRNVLSDLSISPDVSINVNGYATGGAINSYLSRALLYDSSQPNWKIRGELDLNAFFYGSEGNYEKTYIDVKDNNGKEILRIDFYQTARIGVNGTFFGPVGNRYPNSVFEISKSGSGVYWSITISGVVYSGLTSKLDASANINAPASVNFIWGFGGHPSNAALGIVKLSYSGAKTDQTINFYNVAPKKYGDAPFTLIAISSANLPVQYTVVSGPAKVSGNTLTITGTGKIVLRADQPGDDDHNSAPSITQSFTVLPTRVDL